MINRYETVLKKTLPLIRVNWIVSLSVNKRTFNIDDWHITSPCCMQTYAFFVACDPTMRVYLASKLVTGNIQEIWSLNSLL